MIELLNYCASELNDNQLISAIPEELANLFCLKRLYVYHNIIQFLLIFKFFRLLQNNRLTGDIPEQLISKPIREYVLRIYEFCI